MASLSRIEDLRSLKAQAKEARGGAPEPWQTAYRDLVAALDQIDRLWTDVERRAAKVLEKS